MKRTPLDPQHIHTIKRLTLAGVGAREIAARIGCTTRTVSRYRHTLGISQPPPPPLTDDEIAAIHRLADDGCSVTEIARTIGRGSNAVRRIRPDAVWTPTQIGQYARTCDRRTA